MPEEQAIRIVFLDQQLDGLYDAGGYRSLIRKFGTDAATAESLAEFDAVADEHIEFDSKSMTHAFYLDALTGIENAFAVIVQQGVCSANPAQWLLIRDMLTCAARLVTCPGMVFEDDVRPDDAIRLTALMVDIFARVSCRRTRHLAGLKTGSTLEAEKRGESIRADIICGRVGAWIAFVDDLGRECSWASGLNWSELLDVYGQARQKTYIDSLCAKFDMSESHAVELMLIQASTVAASYDVLQQRSFARAFSDGFELPEPEVVRKSFDGDILEKVGDIIAYPTESGQFLRAYCMLFGVSAPLSVVFVESEAARILRTAYDEMIANAYGDASE